MNKIGFLKSDKLGEKRIALLPQDISSVFNKQYIYLEDNYGVDLGISNEEYLLQGVNIVSREEIMQLDYICDPKIGDSSYIPELGDGKTLFGYFHAVQNIELAQALVLKKATCYAWEDMFEGNRHIFWRNNYLAGEAAIMHAFLEYGKLPSSCNCAVIGRGNVALGAINKLNSLGAKVEVFNRYTEDLLISELEKFDVVVNAVLWDTNRKDHIISKEDLKGMKRNSMIIDISCDKNGGIETSFPTSISKPTYVVDGILHYVVDNTPSILFHEASQNFSLEVSKFLDQLITGFTEENSMLRNSLIINKGEIIDVKIIQYQKDKGLSI